MMKGAPAVVRPVHLAVGALARDLGEEGLGIERRQPLRRRRIQAIVISLPAAKADAVQGELVDLEHPRLHPAVGLGAFRREVASEHLLDLPRHLPIVAAGLLELRALVSLARTHRERGEHAAVTRTLAPARPLIDRAKGLPVAAEARDLLGRSTRGSRSCAREEPAKSPN
jgi:hypothetical protein